MPKQLHDEVKTEAGEDGVTISEYIRGVLLKHLSSHKRQQTEAGIITLMKISEVEKNE